ncbi:MULTISPECIES: hypothetical protein [Dehalobacter]|jgi:hypothetical protein|uniref:Uncharacterized protein n=1 Tax=Dehalobacter restrictus (strain DSM 9455 / PER-K23) TaxID=871738 RepID=A0ABM5P9C2_DEHRP|nr:MULTISPECIES: hypothetical protein [Dehalobacter]AHF11433.1 hypothetical protein DEHRE_10720 [Dehalobacter restrictus DSM 9455]MDJ0304869.1 hypothetical protein [Dehalobacter sp.]
MMGIFKQIWMRKNENKDWLSKNEYKALKAVEKLTDQATLVQAAMKGECRQAREAAVIKLNGGKELIDGDSCPLCGQSQVIESKTWSETGERLILSNNIGNDYYVPMTTQYYQQKCKYCQHIYKNEKKEILDGDSTDFRLAPYNR